MTLFSLTIQGYRRFVDPLTLEISAGMTALVGPNNSGKSSILRLFYELRKVWDYVGTAMAISDTIEVHPPGIGDWTELFHADSDAPLTIRVLLPGSEDGVAGIDLTMRRDVLETVALRLLMRFDDVVLNVDSRDETRVFAMPSPGRQLGVPSSRLHELQQLAMRLRSSCYIGPFRNALGNGGGAHYDMYVGTEFVNEWDSARTGADRARARITSAVLHDLREIFDLDDLNVVAAPDNVNMAVTIDHQPHQMREMGSGLTQFLMLLGSVALRKPKFLLIDEPELHLHPALQRTLLLTLASYTDGPVMFSTHSIGLARTVADTVFTVCRTGRTSIVRQFAATASYAEFLGAMSFSTFRDMGYSTVLLVEGVTEVKAVHHFLRLLGCDHSVVVLPLGGNALISGERTIELAEVQRLASRIVVLVDSERTTAGAPLDAKRAAFAQLCHDLKFQFHATERRAFENYFPDSAVREAFGPKYRSLAPFAALRDARPAWAKFDNWRAARHMTREQLLDNDVGKFLHAALTTPTASP